MNLRYFSSNNRLESAKKGATALLRLLVLSMTATGCLTTATNKIILPKITTSATTTSSYELSISNVVLDQSDPAGTFDVLGDGSNTIATKCAPTSGDTSGKSGCLCVYNYVYTDPNTSASTSQQIEVDTTYYEANQLHCPYASIPASVSSVGVSLRVKSTNGLSNSLTYSFSNATGVLDNSKDYNFSRIFRYTCRQKIYVPNALDPTSGIYDPYQSEGNPANSYPVSFYTSNIGAALNAFAGGTGTIISDYDCPANPRHPASAFAESIYSLSPGPDGNYVISGNPGQGAAVDMNVDNPRSTFYLSKSRTGIFTVPVNAYIAPYLISTPSTTPNPQGGGLPALGWGATPRSTGVGTETCPADSATNLDGSSNPNYVTIPSGYHWVKVWVFRTSLPQRHYLYGSNLQRLGPIGCNPGRWETLPYPGDPTNPLNSKVPDCLNQTALGAGTAARFSPWSPGTGMCFSINPQSYAGATPDLSSKTDIWTPAGNNTNFECNKSDVSQFSLPWSSTNSGGLGVCSAGAATGTPPFDNAPVAQNIDDPSSVRYEFFFVVTPKTVNSGDMSNSSSGVYSQFAPMRFRVDSDCNSVNPNGCGTQYMFRNYGLKLHDISSAGDPPAGDPNRVGTFPICALQPDSVLGKGL